MADKRLTTCLWFDTGGEDAAQFYCDVFKDSKLGRTCPTARPAGGMRT